MATDSDVERLVSLHHDPSGAIAEVLSKQHPVTGESVADRYWGYAETIRCLWVDVAWYGPNGNLTVLCRVEDAATAQRLIPYVVTNQGEWKIKAGAVGGFIMMDNMITYANQDGKVLDLISQR